MQKKVQQPPIVLGIDLGANSIGWAVLKTLALEEGNLKPVEILRTGVRIFPFPNGQAIILENLSFLSKCKCFMFDSQVR